MGSASSNTRRLTIPNDDNAGVIKVSDSVVQRLKIGSETPEKQEASRGNESPKPSPISSEPIPLPPLPSSQQQQQQVYMEPSLTSLQILRDKEQELRRNDQYWEQRLHKLQENHREVNRILEEEYARATREVSMKFASKPQRSDAPPCDVARAGVMECYTTHPKNTLACSKLVQAFSDCVHDSRLKHVA